MWKRKKDRDDRQQIFRHEHRKAPKLAVGDPALMAAIEAHVEAHFGPVTTVWHELVSFHVHVDVLIVDPAPGRPERLLVTSGMSQLPMAGSKGPLHAELLLFVPPDWDMVDADGRPSWPVTLLQGLAQLPHDFDTLLWVGHTVPNDDPPRPYDASTELCGAIIAQPLLTPDAFDVLELEDRKIRFLSVIPLHRDEMDYKLEHGADALFARLDAADLSEALRPDRPSAL